MEMLETIFPVEASPCSSLPMFNDFASNDSAPCRPVNGTVVYTGAPLYETHPGLAIPYLVIVSVALLVGTIGNGLILLVSATTRGINKAGKEFIVNLALADLCVSAVADPFCIVGVMKGERFFNGNVFLCEFVAGMCLTACFCAFLSLTCLTINRYFFVCHNNFYDFLFGRKTCIVMCILIWPIAFVFEMPNILGWGNHGFDSKNHSCIWDRTASLSYTLFVSIGLIGGPLMLMGFCYVVIFRHIWDTKKNLYKYESSDPNAMKKAWGETVRTSRTLFVVFCVFLVCWLPYTVVIALDVNNSFPMWLHLYVTLLAHLHSSANCIVYASCNQKFRTAIIKALGFSCVDKTTSSLPSTTPVASLTTSPTSLPKF